MSLCCFFFFSPVSFTTAPSVLAEKLSNAWLLDRSCSAQRCSHSVTALLVLAFILDACCWILSQLALMFSVSSIHGFCSRGQWFHR